MELFRQVVLVKAFQKLLWLLNLLAITATIIACGAHYGAERKLAAEQTGSNDDYSSLSFGGAALPATVLPTQMYVDTAYASVDPSDLLHIDVIVAESIGSHKQKQAIAEALPEILQEVLTSNWVVEIRSMSDLEANPFASVGKYADTFVYRDVLQQGIEKFAPALTRRNIADHSLRLPVYLLISDSALASNVQEKLDSYIVKDQRRRVFALVDSKAADSFTSWQDSDNNKKVVDYSVDLKIANLKVAMQELSGYIADTLRSNFHLHGFCDHGNRFSSYQREPLTLSAELKFYSNNGGYLSGDDYHLTKVDDSIFIKQNLDDKVCLEVSYVYRTFPDGQQICEAMQ